MPISSGALEWPVSYYSKPEKETKEGVDEEQVIPTDNGKSSRGVAPKSYEWQPQLTNREDYEKWRKKMDRKEPLKTKKKKRNGCFTCLSSKKINTENEDPTKGEQRDSPRAMIKRRRRRRCLLLALCVSVLTFLLMAVIVFVFLHYTGHESLGPEDLVECTGQLRSHFLAYADHSNGSKTVYSCCYLPNLDNVTAWTALAQSSWPDGYFYTDPTKCSANPKKCSSCEDCEQKHLFLLFGVTAPCSACVLGQHNLRHVLCSFVFLVLFFK